MEVFVARQPVFDRHKQVHAYELRFRAGFQESYEAEEVDKAAAQLMAIVNFGEMTDGKRGLITFPRPLLTTEFASLLPKDALTIGIPRDLQPDTEALGACRALKESGYTLAMDDFTLARCNSPFLNFIDLARVDFTQIAHQERQAVYQKLKPRGIECLAKRVDSGDDFERAVKWGYAYFQGDFYRRPIVRPEREIPGNKLTYFRVLQEANRPELSYDELESLIQRDVSLAYKLLKFMNSVWFGLRYQVESIRQALVLLGPQEIRQWVSVLTVKDLGTDKPRELLLLSLTRAKAAELIAPLAGMKSFASELFLMGLFSAIDALTDLPMADVLAQLPLDTDIKSVLLGRGGPFGAIYDAILAYERGQWDRFVSHARTLSLDEQAVPALFQRALKWGNDALNTG